MTALRGFVCWQEKDLPDVLFADAGAHGHLQGVFAATHRPIPAVREIGGVTEPVADDAAVDALKRITAKVPGNDPVVIPVLGDPGTGKSHLIRWVWTRLERRPEDDLVVIYVPRVRTSFAGVVELLLAKALEDDDADVRALAASLVNYSADLAAQDVEAVAAGLKTAMFSILKQRSAANVSPALVKDLQTIVIEGGRLVEYFASADSAVGRRAMRFVERPGGDVSIDDSGFTVDEIEGMKELTRLGTSRPFEEAVRRLAVHKQHGDLEVAARTLNWALDQAVAEQTASAAEGRPTLNVVFRRLRESLQRAGKELVILVEDLKLLHGVERALLEILIDPADAIGLEPACRVRALVACTRDPWRDILDDNETLASRLRSWQQPSYILSVPDEQSRDQTLEQLNELAAAYLNAARIGVELLEGEYDAVPEAERDSWLPPVACDACPVRQECHASFGSVHRDDGSQIGLYPFNPSALARAQDLVQRKAGTSIDQQLNPRVLLTQVLQPVLRAGASAIPSGAFPAFELVERLGVPRSPDVTRRLEAVGYPREDMARASATLLLWGVRETDGQQTLRGDIAAAFALEAPPTIGSEDVAEEIAGPEPPGPTPTARDARQQMLSEWLNGGTLVGRTANDARQAVLRHVLDFVDWADYAGVSAKSDALLRELGLRSAEYAIRIEGAAVGEGTPPANTTEIVFPRDEDSYRTFLAVLRWPRRTSQGELYGSDLIDLAEGVERAAATVQAAARSRGLDRSAPLSASEPASQALVASSVILGLDGCAASDPGEFLGSLLAPTPPVSDGSGALEKLQSVSVQGVRRVGSDSFFSDRDPVNREAARQWLLRRVALRQSSQATEGEVVHAIDAARLVRLLNEVSASTEFDTAEVIPKNELAGAASFARLASQINSRAEDALSKEARRVGAWREAVSSHVELLEGSDAGQLWTEAFRRTLGAVVTALKRLEVDGLIPDGSLYDDLVELVKELAPAFKSGVAAQVFERLAAISTWSGSMRSRELAALIAPQHDELIGLTTATAGLVDLADRFLIQATNLVTARLSEEDPILANFDAEFAAALTLAAEQLEPL